MGRPTENTEKVVARGEVVGGIHNTGEFQFQNLLRTTVINTV